MPEVYVSREGQNMFTLTFGRSYEADAVCGKAPPFTNFHLYKAFSTCTPHFNKNIHFKYHSHPDEKHINVFVLQHLRTLRFHERQSKRVGTHSRATTLTYISAHHPTRLVFSAHKDVDAWSATN